MVTRRSACITLLGPKLRALLVPAATALAAALISPACHSEQAAPPPPPEQDIAPVPMPQAPGAIQLFGGKQEDFENWNKVWKLLPDGAMQVGGGNITTKQTFTDFQLHVEFKVPYMPDKTGQGRGNSGVYLQGRYEVQVLDSWGVEKPGTGECGGIYQQHGELVNACKPPLWWQTYDFVFRAARLDDQGQVKEPARVTVIHNGIVVHNSVEIKPTAGGVDKDATKPGPIMLQDHGNPVQYRNIWIVPLAAGGSTQYGH